MNRLGNHTTAASPDVRISATDFGSLTTEVGLDSPKLLSVG